MDKKVYHIAAEGASQRHWVKIVRNLIDIALLNRHELFLLHTPNAKLDVTDFAACIVEELYNIECLQPDPAAPDMDTRVVCTSARPQRT